MMAKKTISVKISQTKKPNRLEVDKDGLYVSKPVLYAGTCNKDGVGLLPSGWQQASHTPGNPDGYVIVPHAKLVREGYSVVCTPRIDADKDTSDGQSIPIDYSPITVFSHTLNDNSFHVYVVDKNGKPVEHGFTWMLIVPE